jgi:RNA polymerase sigma factor (sigma-70 family)
MNSTFPQTSVTLIAKIRDLGPGRDSAEWVRFWDSYSLAIKQFAIFKGGKENADDIVMTVLAKLVDVLRNGQYTPEKGRFHSYLASMIVNEVHMAHRRDLARAGDRKVSLDAGGGGGDDEQDGTLADTLAAPDTSPESLDEDWRNAVLKSATEHVLTKTALSERDRAVYRAYVVEGRPIEEVSAEFRISRNMVSQIKTRIERRIVAVGRELVAGMERM